MRKLRKLWSIIKYFFLDEESLFLYLLEIKARECLEECYKLDIKNTEEIEDLIFHIKSYIDIPRVTCELRYPEFKNLGIREVIRRYKFKKLSIEAVNKYSDFLVDIEKQRAIERDFIFEHAKVLTFGFKL